MIAVAAVSAALAAPACGGGGPSDDAREAVEGFAVAVREGDYEAVCRRYLSNQIRRRLTDQGGCASRVKALVGSAGARAFDLEVVSVKVDGDRARVRVRTTQAGRSATATLALVEEGGAWHVAGLP
jgi:Domain of unknown function (DUF4878)